MIQIATSRPPFVRFEDREFGINAEATKKAGRPVPATVTMAIVTNHGSKDEFVAPAAEWLKQKRMQAMQGTYPADWVDMFEKQFESYKKGEELPRDGTPVKTWSAIKTEQRTRLIAVGFTTIEDLAQIPDSGLNQIGLDGRYLRDLARSWIAEGQDKGIAARELADAKVTISNQQAMLDSMGEQLRALQAQVASLQPPERKRAAG